MVEDKEKKIKDSHVLCYKIAEYDSPYSNEFFLYYLQLAALSQTAARSLTDDIACYIIGG